MSFHPLKGGLKPCYFSLNAAMQTAEIIALIIP